MCFVVMSADSQRAGYLPLHRSEALTDGIYAVAMTLLVIELKLPDSGAIPSADEFVRMLVGLIPKGIAWLISFFVLALFWIGHHRVFAYLRHADSKLTALNLIQLAFVSLMPFSCAVVGQSAAWPVAGQAVYSFNMAMLGLFAWLIARHVFRHPELTMPSARYAGARLRIGGVILVSAVAVLLTAASNVAGFGNTAFMLMAVVNPASRWLERRELTAQARAADLAAPGG